MLQTDWLSPLEGALEGLTNILAVSDNMNSCLKSLDSFEEGCDLSALGGLGWAHDRAMGSDASVGTETPTRSRACGCGATSTISGDNCHLVIK